jgi:glucose-1-phosphatase
MRPQFIYFDMGNVLLRFSHERQAEQMARVAGVEAQRAWDVLFEEGLHWELERGDIGPEAFYARFCEQTGSRLQSAQIDLAELDRAANDIFDLNVPIVPLCGHLAAAGYRLGVLSNTTEPHWRHCTARFGILTSLFQVHALSFRLRSMKPDPRAYEQAAELAGVPAGGIFYTDDREDNVTAACEAGYDAVLYESVAQLNLALHQRGVRINY